jgi:hypothetical protein
MRRQCGHSLLLLDGSHELVGVDHLRGRRSSTARVHAARRSVHDGGASSVAVHATAAVGCTGNVVLVGRDRVTAGCHQRRHITCRHARRPTWSHRAIVDDGLAIVVCCLGDKGTVVAVHARRVRHGCLLLSAGHDLIHGSEDVLVRNPECLALRHGDIAIIGGVARHARAGGFVGGSGAVGRVHVECCHSVRQTLHTVITVGGHGQTSREVLGSMARASWIVSVEHVLAFVATGRGVSSLTGVGRHGDERRHEERVDW